MTSHDSRLPSFCRPMSALALVITLLPISACKSRIPDLEQPPPTTSCLIEVSHSDGMGVFSWPWHVSEDGRIHSGEWSETYTGRGQEELHYDGDGRLVEATATHRDGNENYPQWSSWRALVEYDDAGHIVAEETEGHIAAFPVERTEVEYEYDRQGRLAHIDADDGRRLIDLEWDGSTLTHTRHRWHDITGSRLVEQADFNWESDTLLTIAASTCAEDGTCWDSGRVIEVDALGRILSMTPGISNQGERYEYDGSGRLARRTVLQGSREIATEYVYDDRGRLIERRDDGSTFDRRTYTGECPSDLRWVAIPTVMSVLSLEPCIQTKLAGCLTSDGRRAVRWYLGL